MTFAAVLPAAINAFAAIAPHLFGGGDQGLEKVSTLSKGQRGLQKGRISQAQQLAALGGGYSSSIGLLEQLLNPQSDVYKNFEAPYRREFQEQTIPQLAERFAGFGAQGGALSSSGFGQSLGAAGAGLQEKLAYLKEGLRQSAVEQLLNQYNRLSEGAINTPEFAYYNPQTGASPFATGANAFTKNMTPGGWNSILNLFQGKGGGGYEPQYGLTSGYDQEFRMNPASLGY